jgi:hypothetical protein
MVGPASGIGWSSIRLQGIQENQPGVKPGPFGAVIPGFTIPSSEHCGDAGMEGAKKPGFPPCRRILALEYREVMPRSQDAYF